MVKKGYKNSYIGLIPDDWQEDSWENVLDGFRTGITPTRKRPDYFKGNINWFTSGELKKKYINNSIEKITQEAVDNTSIVVFPSNTFAMAIIGLEAAGTRGSCSLLDVESTINQSCLAVYGTDIVDVNYLYYYYLAFGEKLDIEFCQGTKQQNLSADIVKKFPICFPCKVEEQQAIASALSDIDELIDNLEKLIEKKKNIMQGAMQKLLTGKERLPGFSGKWKVQRLGDYVECIRGVSYDGSRDVYDSENDNTIRLLRSNNIKNARFANEDIQYVNKKKAKDNQKLCQGDIMVCMANGSKALVGKNCIFRNDMKGKYTFGAFMSCVRKKNPNANMLFIYYIMNSCMFWNNLSICLAGSSINNLRPSHILEMEFEFPDPNEQIAIAKILDDMDRDLDLLGEKLCKAQKIKQGMMQKLLTGEIRLV